MDIRFWRKGYVQLCPVASSPPRTMLQSQQIIGVKVCVGVFIHTYNGGDLMLMINLTIMIITF
jgi:hypothetical protein